MNAELIRENRVIFSSVVSDMFCNRQTHEKFQNIFSGLVKSFIVLFFHHPYYFFSKYIQCTETNSTDYINVLNLNFF